ncbi:putative B3 domain-containing protein At5g58280 [Vicia villosa]|uniref:putative B3 domain-containing protein At5g58280 n=1 Tax=Vicia villosa TaxID=3911 RepID=UPI00273CF430|nr:putative B3 domain-containing protein At5g58280 [Vicia villosa]XP_058748005.1 putative B3 domain-containing protein At5g58280 [Vicia villosa]
MAKGSASNNYEEARKLRLEENKKRFQDLGILTISKKLTEIASPAKKSANHIYRPKSKTIVVAEPRRSSRARNPVPSYREEFGTDLPNLRKRSGSRSFPSSWESYIARPLDEIKVATSQERNHALEAAEALQINLNSSKPSFVKSMVRSHVYSCFWLGLPSRFCEEHLPKTVYNMVLENEEGSEYEAVYIGKRAGLSGGWRAFALEHKLDDGDALVFELVEPARFKIYIVRAFPDVYEEEEEEKEEKEEENNTLVEEEDMHTLKATKESSKAANNRESEPKTKKQKLAIVRETKESKSSEESLFESSIEKDVKPQRANTSRKTKSSQKKMPKKSELPITPDSEAKIETPKPKATSIRNTRSSQRIMQKISEASTTLEPKEEAQVEATKKELVQHDDIKLKKVGRPRKNPAP